MTALQNRLSATGHGAGFGASADDLRVSLARSIDELEPHRRSWDALATAVPQMIPTLMPGWVEAYLRTRLTPGTQWICAFAYRDHALVGVLPVVIAPHPLLGARWPLLRTPSDSFTPASDILLSPDQAGAALSALLDQIDMAFPTHAGFEIGNVRRTSPLWAALKGVSATHLPCTGIRSQFSYLDVTGDHATYLSSLGNMRRNLKRFRKKLDALGAVTFTVEDDPATCQSLFDEFVALEASGWKGRNGTAMADNEGALAFYRDLLATLGPEHRIEWHSLRVEDRLVATQLCIRCGESLMLAKIAFDETFSDCRPGHVLTGEVIGQAFQRQDIRELNHLSNADWEGFWRMSYDEYCQIDLVHKQSVSFLVEFPRAARHALYQSYVRPYIPTLVKDLHRRYKRRGDRKPLSNAQSRASRGLSGDPT